MPDAPFRLWRVEGGKARLSLNEAQLAAWDSPARFTFLVSGTRAGKTALTPWWLSREITRTARPEGGNDYLAMTSTYRLFENAFRPAMFEVFENVLKIGRFWPASQCFELADPQKGFWAKRASDMMWGRILMRTAEAWESAEGMRARAAVLDECGQSSFDMLVWEAVLRRVSQDQGRVLGATTPYNLGYLHQLYQDWLAGDRDMRFLQFPSTVNPAFPAEEFERARRTMPAWRFNMMYGGLFERPEGLIYGDFDEKYHWVAPVPLDPTWPTYVGIDPGPLNTAVVWITENPNNQTFFLRQEYWQGERTSPQHAAEVLARSKMMNVVAWRLGAPSEHQYRWDWQAAGVPVTEPIIPDVEAGIDRIVALFKTKRIFIFNTCKYVKDELGTYGRKLDESGQPTDAIANKEKFHLCLTGDTLIETQRGLVPLEKVNRGDWVRTRLGFRRVILKVRTNPSANVLCVSFSNGINLRGTGDHPVWVMGNGFSTIDTLRYGDRMVVSSIPTGGVTCKEKLSYLKELPITDTRIQKGCLTENTSSFAANFSIGKYGKQGVGRFLRDILSITKTAIQTITRSEIWSWLKEESIVETTTRGSARIANERTLTRFAPWHQNGMDLRLVCYGTGNMERLHTRSENLLRKLVLNAGNLFWTSLGGPKLGSALIGANPLGEETAELMTKCARVSSVARSSPSTNIRARRTVPVHVLCVKEAGRAAVYNLLVDGAHEFFANGILVSNCDALRYIAGDLSEPEGASVVVMTPGVGPLGLEVERADKAPEMPEWYTSMQEWKRGLEQG